MPFSPGMASHWSSIIMPALSFSVISISSRAALPGVGVVNDVKVVGWIIAESTTATWSIVIA